MKLSILRKLFVMISTVLIVSFLISMIVGSLVLEFYFLQTKITELKPQMTMIAEEIGQSGRSSIRLPEQGFILKAYDLYNHEMDVFPNGFPANEGNGHSRRLFTDDAIRNTVAPFKNKVLMGGEVATIVKTKELGGTSIILAYPIRKDGYLIGSLFLLKPVEDYISARTGFYVTIMLAASFALAVTLLVIYRFLRPMIAPIQVMTASSDAMAKGNYDVRVPTDGYGELGELAQSLNILAASLERNHQAAMMLEQLRRDYVANVSHELRTPIAAIRAMSETLCDHMLQDEEEKQKYYHMIMHESIRLQRLINDMLELSRLQSGSTAIEKTMTDAAPIVKRVSTRFAILADDLDIQFTVTEQALRMPRFFGHADRVEQVLVILLDNAFKFTDADGSVIVDADWDEEVITVSVADTGVGIHEDDMPFVFDRFYKSDKSHSSAGTGLGLSLAKEIITRMGETIGVESVPGGGTRFFFTLHRSAHSSVQ